MKSFMNKYLPKRSITNMFKKKYTNPNSVQQPEVLHISHFMHTQTLITKAENKEKVQKAGKCI